MKSLRNTPLGYTEQLAYIKSIDILNKNTQDAKKARLSQKHQLAILIMHATKKGDIWWRPRPKLLYISEGSVSHQLRTAIAI